MIIADAHNNVIRKVNKSGTISTVVGNGAFGFGGDLGNALGAQLWAPYAVATDVAGNIYIADADNQRVREAYYVSLGVNNMFAHNDLDMYPNPSASQITLKGLTRNDKVCVYDVTGRQVGESWNVAADGAQTFNIQSLVSGTYMLQVYDASGSRKAVAQFVKE